jgi:chromosome segregation ATPase
MSDAVEDRPHSLGSDWDRLELAVRRLVGEHERARRAADAASRRVRELEEALAGVASGRLDPAAMAERLQVLDEENRRLRERLEAARERVEGLIGRLRFLEEAR